MSGITHKQANQYINSGRAYLGASQMQALTAHLDSCTACQEYASLQEHLEAQLSRTMHNRWDGYHCSKSGENQIAKKARRNARFRNAVKYSSASILLVALLFGLIAVFTWVLPPVLKPAALKPDATSPSLTPTIETGADTLPLRLDSVVCAEQAYPAPVGMVLPSGVSKVIGGGTVQKDDFIFRLYLYCDDSLRPDDPEHFSDIAGLGLIAEWRYDGPRLEGEFEDQYGIESKIMGSSEFSILDQGSSATWGSGFRLPDHSSGEWQVSELARSEKALQFFLEVKTEQEVWGAILSLKLLEGKNGYLPVDIEIKAISAEMLVP
jgi:hypothetical protein